MASYIRKLVPADLPFVEQMADEKISATNTESRIFQDPYMAPIYKHFILDENTYGHELFGCYGCYDQESGKLMGVLGYRCIRNEPAWVLSFVVLNHECQNSMEVIKQLMNTTLTDLESRGYFQWFVVSKLEKFRAWQKLFRSARLNYHHYVYARTPANQLPKWHSALGLSGNKLFPYDTNISMYVSKSLCTTDDQGRTQEIDDTMLT